MAFPSLNVHGPVEVFPGYLLVPTGGLVAYVHNSGAAALDRLPPGMIDGSAGFFTSVNAALATFAGRSNRGDTVICLPGHTETISGADGWSNIVAGVRILGVGHGNDRPTFHWSAATSNLAIDVANVCIENCILNWAGDPSLTTAVTVAAAITVSAAGFRLARCRINTGVDADQILTVGLLTTAAADDMVVEHNKFWNSAATAEISATGTVIRLIGADRAIIRNNYIQGALATDTDGLIETLTTASTQLEIVDNFLYANGGGNTCAIDFGANLACTGRLERNLMAVDADATAETVVFTRHATNNMALLDNFLVNDNNERGLVIGTASV